MLGGGFMARTHSQAARLAGAELAVIATSTMPGSERAARELGFETPSAGEDFSRHDLDVVHICTPNSTHAEQSLKALDAGANIICEKPLATDSAAARTILRSRAEPGTDRDRAIRLPLSPDGARGSRPDPRGARRGGS